MGFSKGTLAKQSSFNLLIAQLVVAINDDRAHLQFLLLIYIDIKDNLILSCNIVTLTNEDLSILITLVFKVLLCKYLRTINHVRRNLSTLQKTEFLIHILTLSLLQSIIVNGRDTRTWCKVYLQIDIISHNRVSQDGNIREESMLPITLHSICDSRTRNLQLLSNSES